MAVYGLMSKRTRSSIERAVKRAMQTAHKRAREKGATIPEARAAARVAAYRTRQAKERSWKLHQIREAQRDLARWRARHDRAPVAGGLSLPQHHWRSWP